MDYFNIFVVSHFSMTKNITYEINDINCKVIGNGLLTGTQAKIDLSKNINGIYFLKINGKPGPMIKQ